MNKPFRLPHNNFHVLCSALTLAIIIGCEHFPSESDDYQAEPVVSAFLIANTQFQNIRLERVVPISDRVKRIPIDNAEVYITEYYTHDDTIVYKRYRFYQDVDYKTKYFHWRRLYPKSNTKYRIDVHTPLNEHLWAETVIPETFDTVHIHLKDDIYQLVKPQLSIGTFGEALTLSDPNIKISWSELDSAKGLIGIVDPVDVNKNDPLDADWNDQFNTNVGWLPIGPDRQSFTIPWVMFNWAGEYRVEVRIVTEEYFNYLLSSERVDLGLINRPVSNINGGFGIFTGMSLVGFGVNMDKE